MIMKLDVSHTAHSTIIGLKGHNIQRIMSETGTKIHFPDSNLVNPQEKSNSISLSGPLEGVEHARLEIRKSMPFTLSFELQFIGSHFVKQRAAIEDAYGVQIVANVLQKTQPKIVFIKGFEANSECVFAATKKLMRKVFRGKMDSVEVKTHLEISQRHHPSLFKVAERLLEGTNMRITFPNRSEDNAKQSRVTLKGPLAQVYEARRIIMVNLFFIITTAHGKF